MTSKGKRIEKLISLPVEMPFEDVEKVMNECGYKVINVRGSHYTFSNGKKIQIIIKHKGKVKRGYLKAMKDLLELDQLKEDKNG